MYHYLKIKKMSVKLLLLKSGEQVISDVKEFLFNQTIMLDKYY